MTVLSCTLCGSPLVTTFIDLGMSPPCEAFVPPSRLEAAETFYPLHVRICDECLLVQLPSYLSAHELFTENYGYYSSYSTSWVEHARRYTERMTADLGLGPHSLVMEVASNDGYLLQHFVKAGIPVLGIEPAANVAAAAEARGVRTEMCFLGEATARKLVESYGTADLVTANNVLAHVPDLRDFVRGLATLLNTGGTLTLEFPSLARLIQGRQFDTIYHEHFSYFTLLTAARALRGGGLVVTDVEELSTHGGSLRVHAQLAATAAHPSERVGSVLSAEAAAGLHQIAGYRGFADAVRTVKRDLLAFLITAAREGRSVAGYGAPGKGNTLLNHCGIRADLLPFTVDLNPHKHGMFLPGTHIPILPTAELARIQPDYVLVLPWNLRAEISAQLTYIRDWGGRLVFPIPHLEIV